MIQRIDAWIIDCVAQPAVDAAWAWLGIGRIAISRGLIFAYVFCSGLAGNWSAIFPALVLFSLTTYEADRRGGFYAITRSIASLFLLSTFLIGPLALAASCLPPTAFFYFVATCDPPRGKRKDWRETAHKFASQWTWLPAGGKA